MSTPVTERAPRVGRSSAAGYRGTKVRRQRVRAAVLIPWAIPTIVSAKIPDAQRPVRDHQPPADGAGHHRLAHRLDRQRHLLHVGGDHGRRLEDYSLRRAAGARRPADAAQGLLRGGRSRRHPPGQGVLQGHPAADHPGPAGGGDLPPARRPAGVRRDLRADLQLHQHHDHVDLRPPAAGRVPGRRLRQRRLDDAVPDHRPGRGDLPLGRRQLGVDQ